MNPASSWVDFSSIDHWWQPLIILGWPKSLLVFHIRKKLNKCLGQLHLQRINATSRYVLIIRPWCCVSYVKKARKCILFSESQTLQEYVRVQKTSHLSDRKRFPECQQCILIPSSWASDTFLFFFFFFFNLLSQQACSSAFFFNRQAERGQCKERKHGNCLMSQK